MNFRGNVITIRPKEAVCVVASSGRIAIGFVCVVLKASGQSDVFFVCLTRSDFCRDMGLGTVKILFCWLAELCKNACGGLWVQEAYHHFLCSRARLLIDKSDAFGLCL